MTFKIFTAITLTAASLWGIAFIAVAPAQAGQACWYRATNGSGWVIETLGTANKRSRACRRAKRKCNRKLRRAKRRHEIPRGQVTPSCFKADGRYIRS
jgi:hypothetical protein